MEKYEVKSQLIQHWISLKDKIINQEVTLKNGNVTYGRVKIINIVFNNNNLPIAVLVRASQDDIIKVDLDTPWRVDVIHN